MIFDLFKRKFSESVIFSGVLGNYTGIREIYHAFSLQSRILPFVSAKILKETSFKNILQYNGVFEMEHVGQLNKKFQLSNLSHPITSNYDLLNLFIQTSPKGKKIEVHSEITYVLQDHKVVFINVNTDPLEIIRQINPDQIQETVFSSDPSVVEMIRSLQSSLKGKLTPMEIQCLSFSLCSFSSKQTANYLLLSHRTIETYLQNAHVKIGCRCKGDCLELMYHNHLIHDFQTLCYQLMQHPQSVCRSS